MKNKSEAVFIADNPNMQIIIKPAERHTDGQSDYFTEGKSIKFDSDGIFRTNDQVTAEYIRSRKYFGHSVKESTPEEIPQVMISNSVEIKSLDGKVSYGRYEFVGEDRIKCCACGEILKPFALECMSHKIICPRGVKK